MEGTGRYIFRMEFDPDALGNDKMLLDGVDDLLYAVRRQGRSAAAEVQVGDGLFSGSLASRQMDLPDQCVDVLTACLLGVEGLAVGTEAADAPAEGDMDVQPQAVTVRKGQLLIVFVFKKEGLCGTGQPHPCQLCDHMYAAPKYISDTFSAYPGRSGAFLGRSGCILPQRNSRTGCTGPGQRCSGRRWKESRFP